MKLQQRARFIKLRRVFQSTKFILKTKMNSKVFLVPFIAALAVLMLGFSSAISVSSVITTFNDVELHNGSTVMAGNVGDTVPVIVTFTADNDSDGDAKVKVSLSGFDDVSDSSGRLTLISRSTYTEHLSLKLPSYLKNTSKSYTLSVVISDDSSNDNTVKYDVRMQRESYSLDVLSVDNPQTVSAGDNFPVSVVVKNNGMNRLDDGYVLVSIPALDVASKAYFGDLTPNDECDDCDVEDSVQKIVNLNLPENAAPGQYDLEVKVYNRDTVTTAVKTITVGQSAATNVVSAVKSQEIRAGETKTYDLIIVNSGDNIKLYNIQTVSGNALQVSAQPVIAVGPQSSAVVPVTVTASDDADVGTYTFSVAVDGKQNVFSANVVGGKAVTSSVVVLTVILAVIFVVLLIVLVVLLVRKEKPTEEVETSYY